jgi:hypothetical protein
MFFYQLMFGSVLPPNSIPPKAPFIVPQISSVLLTVFSNTESSIFKIE